MRPYHEIPDALKEKYGRNTKTVYNRAIRAEFLFGDDLLDLNEVLHQLGFRKNCTREAKDFLHQSYSRIEAIKNILVTEIDRRYENPKLPGDYFQAIEILELWLKDLNEHKESTDLQKDTKEAVKVSRRLVKIMIRKYLEGEKESESETQVV